MCRADWAAAALLAAALAAAPAHANDSSSELAAGGLVLVKTDAITMQREDLTLSPDLVRVRYEFRNERSTPVTLRVAFPMPDLPVETPGGRELYDDRGEVRAHNIDMPPYEDVNFLNFVVRGEGRTVEPEAEVRAELPDGRNIVDALRRIGGWWLVLHPRYYQSDPSDHSITDQDIGPAIFGGLRDLGALIGDATSGVPRWKTRITFHWTQTFKPGVTVIEHEYKPVLGSFYVDRQNGKWTGGTAGDDDADRFEQNFCIDDAARRTMGALPSDNGYLRAAALGYVLSTGANWAGPIGTFHLTINGNSEQPGNSARLMSLCTDVPLDRSNPRHFEATVRNYTPKADLRVLLVVPSAQ
jgi:hypothetical protein